jgi:hypothetical protein
MQQSDTYGSRENRGTCHCFRSTGKQRTIGELSMVQLVAILDDAADFRNDRWIASLSSDICLYAQISQAATALQGQLPKEKKGKVQIRLHLLPKK